MGLERAKFLHIGDSVWHNDEWRVVADKSLQHGVSIQYVGLTQRVRYKPMDLLRTKQVQS